MTAMKLKVLKETGLILVIATALAAGAYVLRPTALPLAPQAVANGPEVSSDALFRPITIDDAASMFKQGNAVFADARPVGDFEQHHITGAVHLDPNQMEQWSEGLISRYPPEQTIITYCDGVGCDLSKLLAEKLTWLGFEHVYYLNNGWTQWQQQGLPIE